MITGRCECNRVRFEIHGDINDYSHCHCSQCRRMHGAAFATFGGVLKRDFKFTSGTDEITHYASSDDHDRLFCRICGSNILVDVSAEGFISPPKPIHLSLATKESSENSTTSVPAGGNDLTSFIPSFFRKKSEV